MHALTQPGATMFFLAALLGLPTADASPGPSRYQDWSFLEARLDTCAIDWSDLLGAVTKAGHRGADPSSQDITLGWVYPATFPQVRVVVRDPLSGLTVGAATADEKNNESVKGEIVDIEPVKLVPDCRMPSSRPLYAIRVTTTTNPRGYLSLVY